LEDHIQHVGQVLGLLPQAGIQVKPLKYKFYKSIIEYLVILVMSEGLKMDLATSMQLENGLCLNDYVIFMPSSDLATFVNDLLKGSPKL
jgi:hypothetical protein